jgi:hypothetical protein
MMKRMLFAAIAGTLISCSVKAQLQQVGTRIDKLVKIIPPSPEAASLGKYGEVPVGLFTGIPQINVPLYSVKEGNVNVPISLSYHYNGARVTSIASSAGLGWTLNAGGVITRNVRGMPDESAKGYFYRDARMSPLTLPITSSMTSAQYAQYENLAYNNTDLEPDLYSYNFLGYSGKFFIDHNRVIRQMTSSNIKI